MEDIQDPNRTHIDNVLLFNLDQIAYLEEVPSIDDGLGLLSYEEMQAIVKHRDAPLMTKVVFVNKHVEKYRASIMDFWVKIKYSDFVKFGNKILNLSKVDDVYEYFDQSMFVFDNHHVEVDANIDEIINKINQLVSFSDIIQLEKEN